MFSLSLLLILSPPIDVNVFHPNGRQIRLHLRIVFLHRRINLVLDLRIT
nr:MAG TPA: hypothetical protein [Caudoviricetes sp.]